MIKYIKSVLWRVVKRLSYIEDARCLKVNMITTGDIEACVVFKDKTNIGTTVKTQPHYVRSIQIVLRLEWTPLHK